MQGAARAPTDRHGRTQAIPMSCGSTGEPLLSRRPAVVGKRPNPARLFESALSFHIEFLAALEDLRWVRNISRTKRAVLFGRYTLKRGGEAVSASANIDASIVSVAAHSIAGCAI
jgi:hypothetical protein